MYRSAQYFLLLTSALLLFAVGCGSGDSPSAPESSIAAKAANEPASRSADSPGSSKVTVTREAAKPERPKVNVHPEVLIQTSAGDIKIRLDAEKAPRTVDNFLRNYVDRGFYDRTVFHHVEKGFMVATGGYTSELQAKSTRSEIVNEAHNGLKNQRGAVAMARRPEYIHSATSQFFIDLVDNPSLDHQGRDDDSTYGYCVFGQVTAGMDVVDAIADLEVASKGPFPKYPVEPVVIHTIKRLN